MSSINFKGIPTFRILDYEQAIDFYIHFLGFETDWEHRFSDNDPVYIQVSRNNLTLHLSENKRFQTGMISFVETSGIQEFHEELTDRNSLESVPMIEVTSWNTLQLEIVDPFGNTLRFNQNKLR